MPLDPAKLQSVKHLSGGEIQCACPACCENGTSPNDLHLRVFATGAYGCAVNKDPSHSRRIWQLAGSGEGAPVVEVAPRLELPRTWSPELLKRLVPDPTYWLNRGISQEVVDTLRGGVATEGQMKDRWVIPIFGKTEIVGFTGRALKPGMEPRWKHMGKVSSWVWGDLEGARLAREVILVEGPGCRMALQQRGIRGAIVLWGLNMSQAVALTLVALSPRRIRVATNNDVKHRAGQEAAEKIQRSLYKLFDPERVEIALPLQKDFMDHQEEDWAKWTAQFALDNQANPASVTL